MGEETAVGGCREWTVGNIWDGDAGGPTVRPHRRYDRTGGTTVASTALNEIYGPQALAARRYDRTEHGRPYEGGLMAETGGGVFARGLGRVASGGLRGWRARCWVVTERERRGLFRERPN